MVFPESISLRGAVRAVCRRLFYFSLAICLSVLSAGLVHAQNAAMTGRITDPSGALVQDAQVVLTGEHSHVVLKVTSDTSGLYSLSHIAPGTYTLAVDAPGFKHYEQIGVAIQTGQALALDVKMQVGSSSQTVTVTADSVYPGGQVARSGNLGILGNKDVMDTPFNQTSYTSEFIQNQSANTVVDVLDNDASIRHTSAPSGAYEYVSIRGFNVYSSDFSLNGLYGLMPWFGGVPTEFVDRIEVLKGPTALLSGMSPSGALGGAINIVPKRATGQHITSISAAFDSNAAGTLHGDIGRRFGSNGAWGVRANGSYRGGNTYVDGQFRQRILGSLGLDYRGERLRLALDTYGYQEKNRGGDMSGVVMTSLVPKAPSGSTNIAPGLNWDARTGAALFSGEYDIAKFIMAYGKFGANFYNRDGYTTNAARNVQANGDGTIIITNSPMRRADTSGELGLRSAFQTGVLEHAFTLSASRLGLDVKSANTSVSPATNIYKPLPIIVWPAAITTIPKSSDATLQGIAVADSISAFGGRGQLTLGIRRQNVKANNYSTSGAVTSSYDQSAWTPMAGLVIKPVHNLSLYGNYIEGLSQGTTVGTTYQNAGEVLPPYKTKQIEFGAKLETGTIINTLSLYQIKKPSTLTDNSTSPLPTLRLDGQQRNRGVEWEVFGKASSSLRLLGGATYQQGVLTKTQSGLYDGNDAPGAAYWGFNIGGEWDPRWVHGLTLTARPIYTSSQYVNSANTLKLPNWTRVDIGARYSTEIGKKEVIFRGGIKNLLNKNYYSGIQFDSNAMVGAPRTYTISANLDF